MTNENEWRMNDGTVPEGVGPDTVILVWYRDGICVVWDGCVGKTNIPNLWRITGNHTDIIRWRFV